MSVLDVLHWPDPRLKSDCAPVQSVTDDIRDLAADMLETMYAAPGRGLAGPQIGHLVRIFVMDVTWKDGDAAPLVFLNPNITNASEGTQTMDEGCLSIPGVLTSITRPAEVTVSWTSLSGDQMEQTFDGFAAACVQHEMDHLDGVVTFDHLDAAARIKAEADFEALV